MKLYNILSCKGFIEESTAAVSLNFGPCALSRLAIVLLFFINAIVRKWLGEEMGWSYNFWLGMTGAFIGYLIPLIFTGNVGISLLIGIVVMAIAGFGAGAIIGGSDEGNYDYGGGSDE